MRIQWHNPNVIRDADRDHVHERLAALGEGHSDLIDVWVDVQPNPHHRHGGNEVTIRCQARGADLVAQRTADEPSQALWEALRTFERDVHRLRERRTDRRTERPPSPPHLGIIDCVFQDRDYGFLLTDGGEQVYFHRNAVRDGLDFERLQGGDRVALNFEPGEKGPQATVVMPAPPGAPAP